MNSGAHRKTILAGFIGNVLEWYDFAIYGYFAPIIARHFFPSEDPTASLIATFGVFAAGYMARPVGGAIFGHIGDTYGRKLVLTLSVGLMGISTFLIGVLPDHAAIGVSATILLLILSAIVTTKMDSIVGAFKFMMTIGAGTGLVYILRWFWWRINAWSEITAMLVSLTVASTLMLMGYTNDTNEGFTMLMLVTTLISTAAWVTVTLLTKPVDDDCLDAFYRRVQPGGRLWKKVSDRIPESELTHVKQHIGLDFLNWILGSLSVWLILFGIGRLILAPRLQGAVFIVLGLSLFYVIYRLLRTAEQA